MRHHQNRGLSLMEVILAIAILGGGLATIGSSSASVPATRRRPAIDVCPDVCRVGNEPAGGGS